MSESLVLGACVIALAIMYAGHKVATAIMFFGSVVGYTSEKNRELVQRNTKNQI